MSVHTRVIGGGQLHYHQQERDIWCGAACVQMVLHFLAPNTSLVDQNRLRTNIENRATAPEPDVTWYAAPDGIEATLNAFPPPPPGGRFHLFGCETEPEITHRIVWSIEHHGVPVIALVYGQKHWLVVRGYTADRPPADANDTGYALVSLDLFDPWPPLPKRPHGVQSWPPPHTDLSDGASAKSDGCGSGGDRGILLNNVSYDAWRTTGGIFNSGYMTGVPASVGRSKWAGLFVAICDPTEEEMEGLGEQDERATDGNQDEDEGREGREVGEVGEVGAGDERNDNQPFRGRDEEPAMPDEVEREVMRWAVEGLEQYGLAQRDEWQKVLKEAHPARPYRVGSLGDAPGNYYIVPFEAGDRRPAAVRVEASTGRYLQSVAVPDANADAITMISPEEVLERVMGREFEFEGGRRIMVRSEDLSTDLPLVWKPCLQSFSPFYPFYQVGIHIEGNDYTLYVRAHDGEAFAELDENVAGA